MRCQAAVCRLLQVITPQHTIDYRHNALGNRVAKLLDGEVVEQYLWQNKTTLLATYDGQGNLKQRFEYTLGHTPTRFEQDGETYYILSDHLGSPRVITDTQGDVIRSIDYDAYGHVIADSNPEFVIPFGFAGGLYDEHTGLVRFGYRDYDPHSGRWTARDPIGFAGGDTNLYGYVLGDPLNFIDPMGWCGVDIDWTREFLGFVPGYDLFDALRNPEATFTDYFWGAAGVLPVGRLLNYGSRALRGVTKGANKAPDFVVSPGGTAFPVPKGATGPTPVVNPAGNRTGVAFTGGSGGANGQVSTMRIMNPTPARGNSPGYPNGYIKYENSASPRPQGVDPYSGKTLPNSQSHFPIN